MLRIFSILVSWCCLVALILAPVAALYYLVNIDQFASLAQRALALPIQWHSVSNGQWYGLWGLTVLYISVGVVGLYFLRRAFLNFAAGEFFNASNSRDLRLFSIFLFVQSLSKLLYSAVSSVLLSFNHPEGQRMLSISFGSTEIQVIVLAMILWVISELLVKGAALENENRQFV